MDYFMNFATIVCTPLFTVIGIYLTEKATTKRKKMDIDANCVKTESDIKKLSEKVDGLADSINDLKASHQQMATMIDVLSSRVEKHNNVIERTYKLERDVAVLDNREKVSENRLRDLENNEKKKVD